MISNALRCAVLLASSVAMTAYAQSSDLRSARGMCGSDSDSKFPFSLLEWNYDEDANINNALLRTKTGEMHSGAVANVREFGETKKVSLQFGRVLPIIDRTEITLFQMGPEKHNVSVVYFVEVGGEYFVEVNNGFNEARCFSR